MTRRLLGELRDPGCDACKMCRGLEGVDICRLGFGDTDANIMVVGKMPDSPTYREELKASLAEADMEPEGMYFASALKCRNFEVNASALDVKTCRPYLLGEIEAVRPKWILCLGNEALLSVTGHSGITKYRGRELGIHHGAQAFATLSPASIRRNPGQRQAWVADLRLFAAAVYEKSSQVPMPRLAVIDTIPKFNKLLDLLSRSELIAYDIETYSPNGTDEFDPDGAIVSLAGTCETSPRASAEGPAVSADRQLRVWAIPLHHPSSPFRRTWQEVLRRLLPHWKARRQVAHNGKFDARWLRAYGLSDAVVTFDTMLAAHLLDENRQKGLKPQAASRLGVKPWALDTKNLLTQPLPQVLKYNALDTWYMYHVYVQQREELIAEPRLLRLFAKMIMPANEILMQAERRGVWMDRERLQSADHVVEKMVKELEAELMEWVPSEIPVLGKSKKPKPTQVNFNPSNFARWLLFDHLELPILARGKEKPDGSPGDPSMAEDVMLELKSLHPIAATMLKRATWIKNGQFITSYQEMLDDQDRIHTSFKLYGTVTGRLSSGKTESEKVSGRPNIRGVNLQQVPRDIFVRGLFGAAPGHLFVEVDFSQVELRVVAFLSRDPTMLRLYQTGQDIHRATAAWVLGVPSSEISKDDRKKAKAVNFGFVYGMGAPKFVHTAFSNYEAVFTLDEAKAVRRQFFERFAGLPAWHAKQRRLVHKYGRVLSPLGRIRRLPDVRSGDKGVVGEAERQAINSPVQSFASDMNLIAMIEVERMLKEAGLGAHILGTVHDATNFEVPEDEVARTLPIIKQAYEERLLAILERRYGVFLDVPIVADLKVGRHWGGAMELDETMIHDWKGMPDE